MIVDPVKVREPYDLARALMELHAAACLRMQRDHARALEWEELAQALEDAISQIEDIVIASET